MSSANCQKCDSTRIAEVTAKCSDMCNFEIINSYASDGYVPYGVGVGGGDYVDFAYCLNCGQMQGTCPKGSPNED